MTPLSPFRLSKRRVASGFALVTVLAILALLLMLVLVFSSVLHVETRVSATGRDVMLARQNALLGLQVAMGQLQEYAGKDQAVTFPATTFYPTKDLNVPGASYPAQGRGEIFDNATFGFRNFADTSSARSYLNSVETYLTPSEREEWDEALRTWWNDDRNPRWTGIMDASLRVDRATNPNAAPTALPAQPYETLGDSTKYGEPKRDQLPVWLVSGNERFTIDQATGEVTDQTGAVVSTDDYPSGYLTPDTPIPDPAADNDSVWLVGTGSATDAADASDGLDGRVKAPKVEIEGADSAVTGHYAYWVGDESTKANFAVRDPFAAASEGSVEYRNRLQVPQRIGWENISGMDVATFDPNDEDIDKVSTTREIGLLEDTNVDDVKTATRENFHSLTAHSRNLLTNTALGGLQQDLTQFLENNGGPSDNDTIADPTRYNANDPRFRAWGGTNSGFPNNNPAALDGIPVWRQIRDWYQADASAGGSISPDPDAGIGPVLTYLMFNGGWSYHGPTQRIRWHWMPCLVLWNPFDVGLSSATYEIEIEFTPALWQGFVVNENPTLAELQAQIGANWLPDADPAADENGDGNPSNDWRFTNTSGAERVRLNPTNPDSVNITSADIVGDSNLADGVTDAFGRLYYRLENPGDPDIYVSQHSTGSASNLGPTGNRSAATRLTPHHDVASPATQRPLQRPMTFSVTASFRPGQAKVFTVGEQQEWVKGSAIPLVNDYLSDEPVDIWFDVMEVVDGPASAEAAGLKWVFQDVAGTSSFANPKVTIRQGGQDFFETEAFGALEASDAWRAALGREFDQVTNYSTFSSADEDGDGVRNRDEPRPAFVSLWRPLYDFDNFADNIKTESGSETDASNWAYGRTWVQPFTGATGGYLASNLHEFAPVLSRFNFAAPFIDEHPTVEVFRNRNDESNFDGSGNQEGLIKYFTVRHRDDEGFGGASEVKWDENQASGLDGYALLTFTNEDGPFQGFSELSVRNARRAQSEILSLGQLQQVNLSPYFWQPAFPIGNSWAPPYTDREAIAGIHSRPVGTDKQPGGTFPAWNQKSDSQYPFPGVRPNNADQGTVRHTWGSGNSWKDYEVRGNLTLDLSYLLNENLFDRYFLSGMSGPLDLTNPLPNSRLRFTADAATASSGEVRDFDTAAAYLENFGALNVNSTSVEAWKALLTAFRDLSLGDNPDETVPVSRTLDPIGSAIDFAFDGGLATNIDNNGVGAVGAGKEYDNLTNGFRYLTDGMIEKLAERIVDEVRLRGPFFSLADFVNRRLVAPQGSNTPGSDWYQGRTQGYIGGTWNEGNGDNHPEFLNPSYNPFIGLQGLSGTLQRAIQVSGINGGVNDPRLGSDGGDAGGRYDMVYGIRIKNAGGSDGTSSGGQNNAYFTSSGIGGASNSQRGNSVSDTYGYRHTQEPSMRSHLDSEHVAGAPAGEAGQLFDGAPGFVTQGDLLAMIGPALAPRGDTFLVRTYGDATAPDGRVLARAWLEAVVQRVAEPVTPAGTAGTDKWRYTDKFGRKFEVIQLRWLSPEEV